MGDVRPDLKTLGKEIQDRRIEKDWSQRDLAEWCGISAPYVYKLESGTVKPSVPVIRSLADALSVARSNEERFLLRARLLSLGGFDMDAMRDEFQAGISAQDPKLKVDPPSPVNGPASTDLAAHGEAAGFWSYAHDDNLADDGRILRLAERLSQEYALLTGDPIKLFVDRKDLGWGDNWRQTISEALQQTTFFIPLITRRYLKSEECRRELLMFAGDASSFGVEELLLPIIYGPVDGLSANEESQDEVIQLVKETQFEDWRDLRLHDEGSAEYRRAINKLATKLADIAQRVQAAEPPVLAVTESSDDAPGFIEQMLAAEEAMPRATLNMSLFTEEMKTIGGHTQLLGAELSKTDRAGKGFAGRLKAIRDYVKRISPTVDRIERYANEFASEMVEVNPAVLTLIRMASEDPATAEELGTLFDSVRELAQASANNVNSAEEAIGQIKGASKISRELRPPLDKLVAALTGIADSSGIAVEWARRIDELQGQSS